MERIAELEAKGVQFRVEGDDVNGSELVVSGPSSLLASLHHEFSDNKDIIKTYIRWRDEFMLYVASDVAKCVASCLNSSSDVADRVANDVASEAPQAVQAKCLELARQMALEETAIAIKRLSGTPGDAFRRYTWLFVEWCEERYRYESGRWIAL